MTALLRGDGGGGMYPSASFWIHPWLLTGTNNELSYTPVSAGGRMIATQQ